MEETNPQSQAHVHPQSQDYAQAHVHPQSQDYAQAHVHPQSQDYAQAHSNVHPQSQIKPKSRDDKLELLKEPCPPFSLFGQFYIGYCIDVYDGDTCTVNIHSITGNNQWKIRMLGYDSPERKTKNANEKKYALAAREMLMELIYKKYVVIECGEWDKYGRLLGTVFIKPIQSDNNVITTQSCVESDCQCHDVLLNVNRWMLENTPCIPYDGGTKVEIIYNNNNYHPSFLKHFNDI
jgi:endonuclease YncB( thermonuclease family)